MADPKFFPKSKKLTLDQISKLTKISLPKLVNKKRVFVDISTLDTASQDNISFLDNRNYINQFKKSFWFINTAMKQRIPIDTSTVCGTTQIRGR